MSFVILRRRRQGDVAVTPSPVVAAFTLLAAAVMAGPAPVSADWSAPLASCAHSPAPVSAAWTVPAQAAQPGPVIRQASPVAVTFSIPDQASPREPNSVVLFSSIPSADAVPGPVSVASAPVPSAWTTPSPGLSNGVSVSALPAGVVAARFGSADFGAARFAHLGAWTVSAATSLLGVGAQAVVSDWAAPDARLLINLQAPSTASGWSVPAPGVSAANIVSPLPVSVSQVLLMTAAPRTGEAAASSWGVPEARVGVVRIPSPLPSVLTALDGAVGSGQFVSAPPLGQVPAAFGAARFGESGFGDTGTYFVPPPVLVFDQLATPGPAVSIWNSPGAGVPKTLLSVPVLSVWVLQNPSVLLKPHKPFREYSAARRAAEYSSARRRRQFSAESGPREFGA